MTASGLDRLSPVQRALVDAWLPGAVVQHDHSWGLVDTTVLEVLHGGERLIVKAAGPDDHHLARELRAHAEWLAPWTAIDRGPRLVRGDRDARLLVTGYLPGRLVQGAPAQDDPDAYRQAGALLALLHGQLTVPDATYEARENARARAWLERPHGIAADVAARLRAEIDGWPEPSTDLVPTHGDWQPRNWLVDGATLRVIDLGRADLRAAMSDLTRLAAQDFRRDRRLEEAFLDGYGHDPREPGAWHRTRVREAIGTAAWAHHVGDADFEAQGHRMIAEALSDRARPAAG